MNSRFRQSRPRAQRRLRTSALALLAALIAAGCENDRGAAVAKPLAAVGGDVMNEPSADRPHFAVDELSEQRYFFDINGHSSDQVSELLMRAKKIYDESGGARNGLDIAMVLHGPDVNYFASRNYEQYRDLVDLAAKLDALGFIDLKVCAMAAKAQGIPEDGFPPFIEIVPFGPAEISALERRGYTRL